MFWRIAVVLAVITFFILPPTTQDVVKENGKEIGRSMIDFAETKLNESKATQNLTRLGKPKKTEEVEYDCNTDEDCEYFGDDAICISGICWR